MGRITGFRNSTTGIDIGQNLVEKSYLIDRYPELADTFKQAGLWLWGYNNNGQVGDGTTTSRSSPVQTVAGGTNWKQVSMGLGIAGGFTTGCSAAIKTDGTLWLWGSNSDGQLGDNTRDQKSSPVQTVAAGTNWKQVAMGSQVGAAIKTDGTLWTWGLNTYGSLGDNTVVSKSSPVQTISGGTNWKQVSVGQTGYSMAAIKTDGTLWTWGSNFYGALGDNTGGAFDNLYNKSSPIQTVAGGTNWKQVSNSGSHVSAIKTDGTLWGWGMNTHGGLGNNENNNYKLSPVQTISGGTNWKQVTSGYTNITLAIKTDGTLWGWGGGGVINGGSLGAGNTTKRSSPVQTVAGGTNWKQVNAGNETTTAIKTDGTLWIWGWDGPVPNGNLALGPTGPSSVYSPVQTIAGGTNWKTLVIGVGHGAIRDDSADIFGNPV